MICKTKAIYTGPENGSFIKDGKTINYVHYCLMQKECPSEIVKTTLNKDIDSSKLIPLREYNLILSVNPNQRIKIIGLE